MLNYGYAVLLSTVLQKLFGVGLDPTFGISHVARERSTPLAYDLMEPFRTCVDWRVIQWVQQHNGHPPSQRRPVREIGLGSDEGISQMGHGLSVGAHGVSGFHAGNSGLHRRRGARLSPGRCGKRAALLQTMDTEKFKMGWLVVAFDLPVGTKKQRKAATDFRDFLMDDGYQMMQFSVYARACVSFARQETHIDRLKRALPPEGSVRAIFVTRAQWERSYVIHGSPASEAGSRRNAGTDSTLVKNVRLAEGRLKAAAYEPASLPPPYLESRQSEHGEAIWRGLQFAAPFLESRQSDAMSSHSHVLAVCRPRFWNQGKAANVDGDV